MTTMVERVARAIWDEREKHLPERLRRKPDALDRASGAWLAVEALARAAVASMREPTPDMATALARGCGAIWDAEPGWRAAIDAALSEQPKT